MIAAAAWSADATLSRSSGMPDIDGTVEAGEYDAEVEFDELVCSFTLLEDGRLAAGLVGNTEGWIAMGFGSNRMNGAHIVIGFVRRGDAELKEQTGRGHRHSDAGSMLVDEWDMGEEDGATSLELIIDVNDLVSGSVLDFITAYSKRDGFRSIHAGREIGSLELR